MITFLVSLIKLSFTTIYKQIDSAMQLLFYHPFSNRMNWIIRIIFIIANTILMTIALRYMVEH